MERLINAFMLRFLSICQVDTITQMQKFPKFIGRLKHINYEYLDV